MIYALIGKPGRGKSLQAVHIIYRLRCLMGLRVATDIELRPACPAYSTVLRLGLDGGIPVYEKTRVKDDRGKTIRTDVKGYWAPGWFDKTRGAWNFVVDEADKKWPASTNNEDSLYVSEYFSQHRKYKHNVFIVVQDLKNLHTRIRRQIESYIVCDYTLRSRPGVFQYLPSRLAVFTRTKYSSDNFNEEPEERGIISQREAARMYDWYFTEQTFSMAG